MMLKQSITLLVWMAITIPIAAEPITPEQGIDGIKEVIRTGAKEVHLSKGLFLLPETWKISHEASNVRFIGSGEETVLSGARETGPWELVDPKEQLWRCDSPLSDQQPVRQLFEAQIGRLPRSRMPNDGWFRGDRLSTVDFDVNRVATRDEANRWRTTRPHVFAGLRYRMSDASQIRLLSAQPTGTVIQTISAWTSAWQPVRKLEHSSRDMHLFTPSRYPLAHWSYGVNEGGGTPFAIENTLEGIDQPGEWYWNPEDDTITLRFDSNPNELRLLVPSLETVLQIENTETIEFRKLRVAHSRTLFGRYDQHKDWSGAMREWDETFPEEFPEGLTVPQSAPFTGEAIHISNSRGIQFIDCEITGTGGYAIRLNTNTHECVIKNCKLTDLGAGGINIDPERRSTDADFPTRHLVANNSISQGGRLHRAACAIRIAESSDNRIINNRISHFGYSGISIGWAWNPRPNHTTGNHIIGNDISHVMEVLSDGAGIYTLGSIPGTRIENNHIHDIQRAPTAVGAGNSGIFFDQYSKGALVRNNRLTNIQSWHEKDRREPHPIKHHRNLPSDHIFQGNTIDGEPFVAISD